MVEQKFDKTKSIYFLKEQQNNNLEFTYKE